MDLNLINVEPTPPLIKVERLIKQYNNLMFEISKTINSVKEPNERNNYTFEKSLEAIKHDEQLTEAIETIPYNLLFDLVIDNFQITDVTILTLINKHQFKELLLENFNKIEISKTFKDRKEIIKEALELYEKGYFAGCLCLLHTQLEGIITDYLVYKNILKPSKNNKGKDCFKTIKTETIVTSLKPKVIKKDSVVTGLLTKIELSRGINENFLRLEDYKFDSKENINFADARNNVLHGSNINNFNDKTCFILFIWINSILISIKEEY